MRSLARPPAILRNLYPDALWRVKTNEKKIYLSFDDGPVPGATPAALSILKEQNVPATFFCVGENVNRHPDIYRRLLNEGHRTGNHTMHHLDGWINPAMRYLRDVQACSGLVQPGLFRPPYGRMRRSQFKAIKRKYQVVMWDVLSCDFDQSLAREHVLEISLMFSRPGSIVVFHDSEKAQHTMLWVLPRYIAEMKAQGYSFGIIPQPGSPVEDRAF